MSNIANNIGKFRSCSNLRQFGIDIDSTGNKPPLWVKLDGIYITVEEVSWVNEFIELRDKNNEPIRVIQRVWMEIPLKRMGKCLRIYESGDQDERIGEDKYLLCRPHTFEYCYYKNNSDDITDLEKVTKTIDFIGYYMTVDKE